MIKIIARGAKYSLGLVRRKYYAFGSNKFCYICRRPLRRFCKYGNGWQSLSPFVQNLQMIGSDIENFACPHCGCSDRERHLVMYFDRLRVWDRLKAKKILHIAPEQHFSARIKEQCPVIYIKGDLFPSAGDICKIDITNVPFGDDYFDVIICNHVLEHVLEDEVAFSELFRVLKPGGFAILQTPFSVLLKKSFCDPSINTDKLRSQFYGEADHVRVYGQDVFQKIEKAGFLLDIKNHSDTLADVCPSFYGINPREDLILLQKECSGIVKQENLNMKSSVR